MSDGVKMHIWRGVLLGNLHNINTFIGYLPSIKWSKSQEVIYENRTQYL